MSTTATPLWESQLAVLRSPCPSTVTELTAQYKLLAQFYSEVEMADQGCGWQYWQVMLMKEIETRLDAILDLLTKEVEESRGLALRK